MSANAVRGMDIRAQARSGLLVGPTCGLAPDYLQANLVVVPPVFWACGVTPQAVLMEAGIEFAITHSPGCMFVTDRLAEDLSP